MPALQRWAHCLSERERFSELIESSPLVKGSTGQPVNNPLVGQVAKLTREIAHYEEHFGMTPLARMRLGIDALAELTNRRFFQARNPVRYDNSVDPRDALKVL